MRSFIRANYKIRVPKVRCVNQDGTMVGVIPTRDALKLAQDAGVDLVEVSPNADPPVCRIMDFGKFKYLESLKEKQARKHQHNIVVKEMKFHSNVGEHDYTTKVNHAREFLQKGHRVKISLTFRGRENVHKELGFDVIKRVLQDCEDLGLVEMPPKMMGHSIIAMLAGRHGAGSPDDHRPRPPEKTEIKKPNEQTAVS